MLQFTEVLRFKHGGRKTGSDRIHKRLLTLEEKVHAMNLPTIPIKMVRTEYEFCIKLKGAPRANIATKSLAFLNSEELDDDIPPESMVYPLVSEFPVLIFKYGKNKKKISGIAIPHFGFKVINEIKFMTDIDECRGAFYSRKKGVIRERVAVHDGFEIKHPNFFHKDSNISDFSTFFENICDDSGFKGLFVFYAINDL